MHRFFIDSEIKVGDTLSLSGQEHTHLSSVLRLREGSEIILFNGMGYFYGAVVLSVGKKETQVKINSKKKDAGEPETEITVFMNLVRAEKMDLIVQKLTELNVTAIVPFESRFVTAKPAQNKKERLERISIEACKQCGRATPVRISETIKFDALLNSVKDYNLTLVAYEKSQEPLNVILKGVSSNLAIIVGSEGGFAKDEIVRIKEAGAKEFSLGKRILRAETAAIAAVSAVNVLLWK